MDALEPEADSTSGISEFKQEPSGVEVRQNIKQEGKEDSKSKGIQAIDSLFHGDSAFKKLDLPTYE